MRFTSCIFWLAKDSDYPEQYQDAFELEAERGVAAIADGVSSAIFSGPWARILTHAAVDDPPRFDEPGQFEQWLARRREEWAGQIDTTRLTWYQRPKMVEGAMTTLIWVELWPEEQGEDGLAKNYHLYSFAIGDSCLFHVRDRQWLSSYPMAGSAQFGLNPAVVGSIDRKLDHLIEFQRYDALCLPGDLLVLATDAIALWAVERREAGDPVDWEAYCELSDEAWRDEIFSLRSQRRMRFDDSTLVLLRVIEETPAPAETPPAETPPAEILPAGEGAGMLTGQLASDEETAIDADLAGAAETPEAQAPAGEERLAAAEGDASAGESFVLPEDALVSADGEPAPALETGVATDDLEAENADLEARNVDVLAPPGEP